MQKGVWCLIIVICLQILQDSSATTSESAALKTDSSGLGSCCFKKDRNFRFPPQLYKAYSERNYGKEIITVTQRVNHGRGETRSVERIDYLLQYGYMDTEPLSISTAPGHLTTKPLREALADFQRFNNLNVTGDLDEQTIQLMNLPRCGNKDVTIPPRRTKRYALQGSKWAKGKLRYKILKYPRSMSREDVSSEIDRAFKTWTQVADVDIEPAVGAQTADFNIKFEYRNHGDGDSFDGPGGTLAHATFPLYGGNIHFDASETWTKNSHSGINLYQTAVHEIGHALGLDHSSKRKSIMAPYYRGYTRSFYLHQDDIDGIQYLYGERKDKSSKENTEEDDDNGTTDNLLCKIPVVDAIFMDKDNDLHVFKGSLHWIYKNNSLMNGYPKLISETWPEIPNNIDAAFYSNSNRIYFFKGSRYWKYTGNYLGSLYPKLISRGFPGIPSAIDGIIEWSLDNTILFFKGSKFWKYDASKFPQASSPKQLSEVWKDLPNEIDGVFKSVDNTLYFYKGDLHYKTDYQTGVMSQGYPKSMRSSLFNCQNAKNKTDTIGSKDSTESNENTENTVEDIDGGSTKTDGSSEDEDTKTELSGTPDPILCNNPTIDVMLSGPNGITFVLKGSRYWALRNNSVVKNYPKSTSSKWSGLLGYMDAGFRSRNGDTYLFRGSKYWRFDKNYIVLNSYPKEISEGFPGIPNNLAAAFSLSNGTAFFFKGPMFWKFDSSRNPPVSDTYPKLIYQYWEGIPDYLDEVYRYSDDKIYFFKDNLYYRWDSLTSSIPTQPSYPQETKYKWFGCNQPIDMSNAKENGNSGKIDPQIEESLCSNLQVDAIFTIKNGTKYIFRGSKFWVLDTDGDVAIGYPKLISETWPNLPNNIDTAFALPDNKFYFFKGKDYWIYEDGDISSRFPKKIETDFPGIPNNIDAVLYWKRIYFFKGDTFWIFDPSSSRFGVRSFPRNLKYLTDGIPSDVDTVFEASGNIYFVKGHLYFMVEDPIMEFWGNKVPVPKSLKDLFRCKRALTAQDDSSEEVHLSFEIL